ELAGREQPDEVGHIAPGTGPVGALELDLAPDDAGQVHVEGGSGGRDADDDGTTTLPGDVHRQRGGTRRTESLERHVHAATARDLRDGIGGVDARGVHRVSGTHAAGEV